MSSISRREVGYNERDLKIGIGLGAGMSGEDAAEFAGVTRATVYNRKAANAPFIDLVASLTKAATAASVAVTIENAKRKWLEKHGRAQDKIGELVDNADPNVALRAATIVVDRVEGKATQRIESSHEERKLDVKATMVLDAGDLAFLMGSVRRTAALIGPKREEEPVFDAELIEDFEAELIEDSDSDASDAGDGQSSARAA